MHLIRGATITVSELGRSVAAWSDWLDYRVVEQGVVSEGLARSWGAPSCAGARMAVLQPASGANCTIRFVEQPMRDDYKPLRTLGWAAVELCVTDTDAVADKLSHPDCPFTVIGPPKPLDGMDTIYPMQVRGPDGEIIYLTQIKKQPDGYRLKVATSLIDQIFILVLACRDLEATGAWIEERLGLIKGATFEIDYTMINKSFGLTPGTKHPLATLKHSDDVFLEIDTYPEQATPRAVHDGWLPPGVAMASFAHPDFDALEGWAVAPTGEPGARRGLMRGPDGARFEILEMPL